MEYPEVSRRDTKEILHGLEVRDPYRHLEVLNADTTRNFIEAQNAVARGYVEEYRHREHIRRHVGELWNIGKRSTPFQQGDRFFQYADFGGMKQSVLMKYEQLDQESAIFLDPNKLTTDGSIVLAGIKIKIKMAM